MDFQTIYNVPHDMPLGVPIAVYFYLTGLSAGSFVVSVISIISGRSDYKPIGRIGAVVAPLTLLIAPVNLLIDLEQPLRFWHLFVYWNPQSPITYGSFLLTIYPINGIIYAWFLFRGDQKLAKALGMVGIPLAIATHGYTGFILALGKGRALWSTALMPTLFIVSAMVSGIGLMIALATLRWRFFSKSSTPVEHEQDRRLILSLAKIMGAVALFDLFLVGNDVLVLFTSKVEELEVAKLILTGAFAPLFVGVEICLGGLLPAFLVFFPRTGRRVRYCFLASILTLIGILAMRIVVVIAGQSTPLH
ncbi:MAG: NrfD/PsrC family molybdoenzyme membrane anchor subunit [Armatimonadota bacterium]|nr:NrfD/PsrC family molybdoenzyme membrane anchor subunit [Armatimonadota bacterium]